MTTLLPYGDRALMVELADAGQVVGFLDAVAADERLSALLEDLVPGARTVLAVARPDARLDLVRERLAAVEPGQTVGSGRGTRQDAQGRRPPGPTVEVPVTYDGPDLPEVARLTGLAEEEVVAAHTGTPWRVAFGGFAPGFAYLVGGDPRLRVPRRDRPRTSVPAGSVGLAGEFSGIYPRESPGGWQLIGRTDLVLWDLDRDPPALLSPGATVRFTAS